MVLTTKQTMAFLLEEKVKQVSVLEISIGP